MFIRTCVTANSTLRILFYRHMEFYKSDVIKKKNLLPSNSVLCLPCGMCHMTRIVRPRGHCRSRINPNNLRCVHRLNISKEKTMRELISVYLFSRLFQPINHPFFHVHYQCNHIVHPVFSTATHKVMYSGLLPSFKSPSASTVCVYVCNHLRIRTSSTSRSSLHSPVRIAT
jgi:hypothetical protein